MRTDPFTVTVVVPHHNDSQTLGRALSSVTAQTLPAHEVILVDDCSAPEHLAPVRALAAAHPRVRLVELEQNVGPATARNVGWDQAQGDWIAFLDSDDAWHPEKLAQQRQAIASSLPVPRFVGSRMIRRDEERAHPALDPTPTVRNISRATLLVRNPFPTPSVLVHRSVDARFPEGERACEDYSLWLQIAALRIPMARVEAGLVETFKHPYGEAGLSADVLGMMRGEVRAFARARQAGWITTPEWCWATAVMLVRFLRQLVIHRVRLAHTAHRIPSFAQKGLK